MKTTSGLVFKTVKPGTGRVPKPTDVVQITPSFGLFNGGFGMYHGAAVAFLAALALSIVLFRKRLRRPARDVLAVVTAAPFDVVLFFVTSGNFMDDGNKVAFSAFGIHTSRLRCLNRLHGSHPCPRLGLIQSLLNQGLQVGIIHHATSLQRTQVVDEFLVRHSLDESKHDSRCHIAHHSGSHPIGNLSLNDDLGLIGRCRSFPQFLHRSSRAAFGRIRAGPGERPGARRAGG